MSKWPFVTRKRLMRELSSTRQALHRMLDEKEREHEEAFAKLRSAIYDLRLDVVQRQGVQDFILSVRFSEPLLRYSRWSEVAPYIAARMQSEIGQELARLNFSSGKPWPPHQQPRNGCGVSFEIPTETR